MVLVKKSRPSWREPDRQLEGEKAAVIRAVRNLVLLINLGFVLAFKAGTVAFWANLAAFLDVAAIDVERLPVI